MVTIKWKGAVLSQVLWMFLNFYGWLMVRGPRKCCSFPKKCELIIYNPQIFAYCHFFAIFRGNHGTFAVVLLRRQTLIIINSLCQWDPTQGSWYPTMEFTRKLSPPDRSYPTLLHSSDGRIQTSERWKAKITEGWGATLRSNYDSCNDKGKETTARWLRGGSKLYTHKLSTTTHEARRIREMVQHNEIFRLNMYNDTLLHKTRSSTPKSLLMREDALRAPPAWSLSTPHMVGLLF